MCPWKVIVESNKDYSNFWGRFQILINLSSELVAKTDSLKGLNLKSVIGSRCPLIIGVEPSILNEMS